MSKKLDSMIIDMKAYGLLMEACGREAERIASNQRDLTVYAPAVGIKQVDAVMSGIDVMLKNLTYRQAAARIACLLFQAAIRDEEDQVADTV